MNQDPPAHYPLDACYYSVMDEPQMSNRHGRTQSARVGCCCIWLSGSAIENAETGFAIELSCQTDNSVAAERPVRRTDVVNLYITLPATCLHQQTNPRGLALSFFPPSFPSH
jgi:hypothetical protein